MIRVSGEGVRRRAEHLGYRILLITLTLVGFTYGVFENCQYPTTKFDPEYEIQKYGTPTAFVSTKSIGISPYSLMDPYRQSTLYHEYLLIGPGIDNSDPRLLSSDKIEEDETAEEIKLNLFDAAGTHYWSNVPNLVQHNLGKESNWALINATGMLPSLTVVNTTFEQTFAFHTDKDDMISYHMEYPHLFRSRTTVPPLDALIEFPAKTKTLLSLHTMIDYQTFGLLRWRLTPAEPVTFKDIKKNYEFLRPSAFLEGCKRGPTFDVKSIYHSMLCINQKRFTRLDNPCIHDMFLFYIIRGQQTKTGQPDTYTSPPSLFITVPMVYELLSYRGWLDLTEVYCSRPDDPEECANPLDIVLTNDHLLIHTDKGLYVSSSLNASNANVSLPYSLKPLLKFQPIDPCANYNHLNCSEVSSPILFRQSIKRQRLFYTPVCHLHQYPIYDDIVILVIEHVTQTPDMSKELDVVTVLFAAKPYNDWQLLFREQHTYTIRNQTNQKKVPIKELKGIFFNHHRRHFDISLLLNDDGIERTIRFVLRIPPLTLEKNGYEELNGLLGNGILDYEFPEVFQLTSVVVNPIPLEVFFLGNQLYIAEAGGPFVYLSVPAVYNHNREESYFDSCSFNHPDRSYVCSENTHFEIFVGRIGVTYSPIGVDYRKIDELKYTMLYNLWPFQYRQHLALLGHFIAGYSGKIMFWYLYDHNELVNEQNRVLRLPVNQMCDDRDQDPDDRPIKCHICKGLKDKMSYSCTLAYLPPGEHNQNFRMISFNSKHLPVREVSTHGPLIPFLIDGDKVMVFEAEIPNLEYYYPFGNYLQDINVGNRILCPTHTHTHFQPGTLNLANCPGITDVDDLPGCELYIRHMKPLHDRSEKKNEYLDGFRQSFYATIIKPFPLRPIPTALVVVVERGSNHAIIQLDTAYFEEDKEFRFLYEHIGQTLYIPKFMSILLTGFPQYKICTNSSDVQHKMSRMVGYATRYYRQGKRVQVEPFKSFFIDFSTPDYCNYYKKTLEQFGENCTRDDKTVEDFNKRRNALNQARSKRHQDHEKIITAINKVWKDTFTPADNSEAGPLFPSLAPLNPPRYEKIEENHLDVRRKPDQGQTLKDYIVGGDKLELEIPLTVITLQNFTCPVDPVWQLADGGCHLQLYLVKHPVLKQSGGRISLDKHDSLSFTLKLRSLTPLGKSLTHRSLLTVTNTNPDVLTVDKKDIIGKDPQVMHITLTPTGLEKGVATVTVRPLIISTTCPFADGSFSVLVQVQREEGRRLYVNYPIPICKAPPQDGKEAEDRPWKVDLPSCVNRSQLRRKAVVRREKQIFYSELPTNYRPPSTRGAEIPTSSNVYNADPSVHSYKDWYRVSKYTGDLNQCAGKAKKDECTCSEDDQFKDDDIYTDCKRMVYNARRNTKIDISVEYDRIMKDEAQHAEFFSPKENWTISVVEINNRTEFTLSSLSSKYLDAVYADHKLHGGVAKEELHDSKTFHVTLHGTGLFHFKVSLLSFESFDKVSGFFMIYCSENALNHVQLVVIMLLTITGCMVLVFCGFLVVRNRLASQLPYKALDRNKIKME